MCRDAIISILPELNNDAPRGSYQKFISLEQALPNPDHRSVHKIKKARSTGLERSIFLL